MKKSLKPIVSAAIILGAALLGSKIYNSALNNRSINKPAYHTESCATGLSGHIEYTRYPDGSQDVKIYPGISHQYADSKLYQDLNGDGIVDRIRENGSLLKANRLTEILIREHDYSQNKKRFDEADKQLQELMTKYPSKK
ncbi:MAG: hypothetical protein PHH54_01640 [Candidatus Nanoarchaeia archaeon]|nr:hypothetical protein [Candidatus Nanoarchaeia archaeon]MDD5740665.1 hypothetical protein [Candidatus Nanoarchaeia archaeon]